METQTIKTEDFWNREHVVEKFWNGLKEGKIYAKKCPACGHIEFPPRIACNECGNLDTDWMELSGKGELKTFVFTGILNARMELEDRGLKYVCGEVKLDEGPEYNAIIVNLKKKKAKEIKEKLPVRIRPVFYDMGEYTTLFFELDE